MIFLTKARIAFGGLLVLVAASAMAISQATAQKAAEPPIAAPVTSNPDEPQRKAFSNDDETDVAMLDRAWADAIPRRDTAIVSRILADDFTGVDPAGNTFTKATYLSDIGNGAFSNDRIELDLVRPRRFGDVAVVTSSIKLNGTPTGGRMTNVYVKRDGRWRCVSSHTSGRTEAFGVVPAPGFGPETIRAARARSAIIRLWFPCRVDQVFVKAGQTVKQGDRLFIVQSDDLGAAKAQLRELNEEFDRTKTKLAKLSRKQGVVDSKKKTELEEGQFRLNDLAQQNNHVLHLFSETLSNVSLTCDANEDTRLTVSSLIDGTVTRVVAAPGKE
jgi:ketosteroid isomerase-like protein